MTAAAQLAATVGIAPALTALNVPRATFYRRRRGLNYGPHPRKRSPRALVAVERQQVLDALHSERFADKAPTEVYATLLDEGQYLCSIRTIYRVLADSKELRERRDQLRHPAYWKPELLATAPNQVWSWDITKLLGPAKWSYFYLYVILDIFSRYVVGWMLAHGESTALAKKLIGQTCGKEAIEPGQLTIHADRGSAMKSHGLAEMMVDLGVTKTHSRPHVSNDNPYSESQFKTMKYRPEFPARFGSYEDAHGFCGKFFGWYNGEHRHSGIGLMTPEAVHRGRSGAIYEARQKTLTLAYEANPERFVRKPPAPPSLPTASWINPPKAVAAGGLGSLIAMPPGMTFNQQPLRTFEVGQ